MAVNTLIFFYRENDIIKVLKTAFLLTVLTLLLIYGGEALAGPQGMTFGLIMALVMNGGAYFSPTRSR